MNRNQAELMYLIVEYGDARFALGKSGWDSSMPPRSIPEHAYACDLWGEIMDELEELTWWKMLWKSIW